MIFGELLKLIVFGVLFGGGKGGGAAPGGGPSVPAGPFPSTKPADLPPWPAGWCPDLPPPPEVIARAWELVPTLWAKGENTRTLEMTGGRWITYIATTVNGQKAVAAYRTTDCEPVSPAVPTMPMPPGAVQQQATQAASDLLLAGSAIGMNEALRLRGYKKSDMVHYQDFQQKAGLKADGYPGAVTMLKLETVLTQSGQTLAPVKIYPWKAGGAYDGINAPTQAEWEGGQVPATSPIAPPPPPAPFPGAPLPPPPMPAVFTGPPPIVPVVTPTLLNNATWTVKTNLDVQHALNAIGYGTLVEDGIIGPLTKLAVFAYQSEHPPLAKDSIPGPQTKTALTNSLHAGEHRAGAPAPAPFAIPALSTPGLFTAAGPVVSSNVDVQHALNLLGYKGKDTKVLAEDGQLGPNSKFAIGAFQKEHPPLAVDQVAGPQTKAALSTALARLSQAA
jgi:peptidoglycan hydrolase-like protein with peptidoglycan-binding domain